MISEQRGDLERMDNIRYVMNEKGGEGETARQTTSGEQGR